jgi:hypothetical protein
LSIVEAPIQVVGHVDIVARHADGTEFYHYSGKNLLMNAGRIWMHNQVYTNTSAGTVGSNFIAVTTDSAAPAAGDTTLTSEIASGGLSRAVATTITPPTGSGNQTTLAKTFTATATHTNVQKAGLFNASCHETTFTAVTLNSIDTLTITWTTTLG